MLLSFLPLALCNGLTSHQWITLQAIERLPEGELKAFIGREDLRGALENGALFPDGGYAVGDDYGEMAHWEPFQLAFLTWIRENDGSDEEKAFLFGLASHGMGDQTFDSMFMERSKVYDAAQGWVQGESMDEATDVALVAAVGPGEVPELWYPEVFPALFETQGHVVEDDTLVSGTQRAGLAISLVAAMGQNPDTVAGYDAQFPWADGHIVDPETRCSPVCEAGLVAAYWEVLWERLEGNESLRVLGTLPEDGGHSQPIEADSPESRLSVVMSGGLDPTSVVPESITVEDADGGDVPVTLNLFYGSNSHVILVSPNGGWLADSDYVVTVHPGVRSFDGLTMEEVYSFSFTTRVVEEEIMEEETPEDTGGDTSEKGANGCGCNGLPGFAGWGWLVGLGLVWRRR